MSVNIDHQKNSITPSTTSLNIDTTGSLVLPKGDTSERYPSTEGAFRVNTQTQGAFYPEIFLNSGWAQFIQVSGTPATGMFIKHDGTKWEATAITTDDITEGSTNKYFTTGTANIWLATKDTDDLSVGTTNLYFTTALARASVSAYGDISYNSATGVISFNNASNYVTKTEADGDYHPKGGMSSLDFAIKDLTVHGTSTVINSTIVTIADPIFSIGQSTVVQSKDRGIEFKYNDGSAKLGFFGQDFDTEEFTYYLDGTNTNEVYDGTIGAFNLTGTSVSRLSDVATTGAVANDFLKFNGTSWVHTVIDLNDLNDVSAASPSTNEVLKFNGTAWAPATDIEGVTEGDAIAFAIALGG